MNTLPEGYQQRLRSTLQPYKDKMSYRAMARAMGAKTDQECQNLTQRIYKWLTKEMRSPLREDAYTYIQTLTGDSNVRAYLEGGVKSPTIEERLSRLEQTVLV